MSNENEAKTDRNLTAEGANADARFSFSEEVRQIIQQADSPPPPPPPTEGENDG